MEVKNEKINVNHKNHLQVDLQNTVIILNSYLRMVCVQMSLYECNKIIECLL